MTTRANVLLLNLTSGENAPKTYEDVVASHLTDQSGRNDILSTGIRKFTNLLVVDTLAGVRKNQGLYESILRYFLGLLRPFILFLASLYQLFLFC